VLAPPLNPPCREPAAGTGRQCPSGPASAAEGAGLLARPRHGTRQVGQRNKNQGLLPPLAPVILRGGFAPHPSPLPRFAGRLGRVLPPNRTGANRRQIGQVTLAPLFGTLPKRGAGDLLAFKGVFSGLSYQARKRKSFKSSRAIKQTHLLIFLKVSVFAKRFFATLVCLFYARCRTKQLCSDTFKNFFYL